MRLSRPARLGLPLLGLPLALSACGHSAPTTPTLSVTCNGSLMLAGAVSIDVATAPGGAGTVLSFPDPADPGHTGTLPIPPGQACSVSPVLSKPASAAADGALKAS